MDFRTWLYERLTTASAMTYLIPVERIIAEGSLDTTPGEKPFLVIRMLDETPEIPTAESQGAQLWAHDEPGSYLRIDEILRTARDIVAGPIISAGGIAADWRGCSPDLADDFQKTIVRYAELRLTGRAA